ncbi:MAG: protein kinase [Verrucomicrobia bacterium]|nr:protein kinase [Verrucomicrobiota bacterium]
MNTPIPNAACPKCGRPIPREAREGLCPGCALAAVATPTEAGLPPESRPPPPARETVAAALPQFEILELIGQGGMGSVFKARQPQLNRLVALKILPTDPARDPKFSERFLREAQALARLNHPNIVAIHDSGEAGGFLYLVMEYVDGASLRQLLRERRLQPEEALAIVPRICEALQFAHDQGVVHRDIKPENVLLDRQGRVKIADFGIAKLVDTDEPRPALTEEFSVIGTPHYMAPEQIERPRLVDHRADIYSLGVVFYEMLTGELPLGKFPPPSRKVQLDVRLDEVVLRSLEKEPERRYQHASEVRSDVETIALTPPPKTGDDTSIRPAKPALLGSVVAARWAARILGTLFILLVTPFILAEGLPPLASQPEGVQLTFIGGFLLFLGFVLGWWREGTAAVVVACGWTVVRISENKFQLFTWFELTLVVAALYAFCWWATRGQPTRIVVTTTAVLAATLAFGRLFVPTSVFLSGTVTDQISGEFLPNAELRLPTRLNDASSNDDSPQARTDAQGRFRLYIGWYSADRPLSISAPGYIRLTTNLGPRELGRRSLPRGFSLQPEFTPAIELTLNDVDDARGAEVLDLHAGRAIDLTAEMKQQPGEKPIRWLSEQRAGLFLDHVRGQWGLMTPAEHPLKLRTLAVALWEQITLPDLTNALAHDPDGFEILRHTPFEVYVFPTNAQPPLTFAYETADGLRGALQITEFTENPNSARIRFKRANVGSFTATSVGSDTPTTSLPDPQVAVAKPGEFTLTLSNGVTCEVVALSRNPRQRGPWWKPNGELFAKPPLELVRVLDTTPNYRPEDEVLVYVRIQPPPSAQRWQSRMEFHPAALRRCSAVVREPDGKERVASILEWPSPGETIDLEVASAIGPWEPIALFDGQNTRELIPEIKVTCGPLHYDERRQCHQFEVMHNVDRDRYALRMVARLQNGQQLEVDLHAGLTHGSPAKGFTVLWPDEFKPDEVKEYAIESTPWVRGRFRRVHSQPNNPTATLAEPGPLTVASDGRGTHASIQAALDAAPTHAVIHVAPGRFAETLLITNSVTLVGSDWNTTVIGPLTPASGPTPTELQELERRFREAATDEERTRLRLEAQERFSQPVVRIAHGASVQFENLKFTQPGTPPDGRLLDATVVEVRDATVSFQSCAIVGSPGNGLILRDGARVNLSRTLVAAAWNTGIRVERGANAQLTVTDSDLRNCHYAGVVIGRGQDQVLLERCRISGAAWHGVRYDSASPTIAECLIFANARSGIYASGSSTAQVHGNVFWRNEMNGISCWFANRDSISNNTFAANLREGLSVLGASSPLIERNIFWQNPQGIYQGNIGGEAVNTQASSPLQLQTNLFWTNTVHIASPLGAPRTDAPTPPSLPLERFPGNVELDPLFRNPAAGDFSLSPQGRAATAGIGAPRALRPDSPFPLQPEEQAIIPESDTRDSRQWQRPGEH